MGNLKNKNKSKHNYFLSLAFEEAKKNEDFDAQTLSEVKRFLEEPRQWQEKRSQ